MNEPQAPLTKYLAGELHALSSVLLWESYDAGAFGGATALAFRIKDLKIECDARDWIQGFELVVSAPEFNKEVRLAYFRAYDEGRFDERWLVDGREQTHWLLSHFDKVRKFLTTVDGNSWADYHSFADGLDQERQATWTPPQQ